jgi:hypothetical protein
MPHNIFCRKYGSVVDRPKYNLHVGTAGRDRYGKDFFTVHNKVNGSAQFAAHTNLRMVHQVRSS